MLKVYKYRIYPTREQRAKIDQTIGVCRLVYNLGLEVKMRAWQSQRISLSAFDIGKEITFLRAEYAWIADVNSQALHSVLSNLDDAYRAFFKGGGFPKFKSKKNAGSFQCHNGARRVDFDNGLLTLPKITDIPIVVSRRFDGKIKTITISRTATKKYFASILVDDSRELPTKPEINPSTTVGIDVGIKSFVITSNGKTFVPNRKLKDNLKRLKCLQRRTSRKKKGSNNRKKANLCVAILHEKIVNQRTDYIHKITTGLIRDNQAETFVIEDLGVAGMLKNRRLSQAITDVSFSEFFRQIKYKCNWYGKNLITIGRFEPSSKRCSDCGGINQELTLANREWVCESCGTLHDRDFNAAKNIKHFGLTGRGASGGPTESFALAKAMKQETMPIKDRMKKNKQ